MIERLVDGAIGETREALFEDGRCLALRIVRAGDPRPRWGEVYAARVARIEPRLGGAFLDLGGGQSAFVPLESDGRARQGRARRKLAEGEGVVAAIVREGARAKNAVAQLLAAGHPGGGPTRLERHESDAALDGAGPDIAARGRIDAAIEEALAKTAPIPGGGVLTIEPTAALVAIDVDAGARPGGAGQRFALDLNIAAVREAARQVRLRALGGIIAIDCVALRAQAARRALEEAGRAAFAADPWGVRMAPLSRFGVLELTRAQLMRPLHEVLLDAEGRLSTESVALMALRAVEREGRAATSRRIAALVAPEVLAWLEASELPWRAALTGRIGPRFTLEAKAGAARTLIDVRAL